MDRGTIASVRTPVRTLEDLLGERLTQLSVWAGKPSKTDTRCFVHTTTRDGRVWFAKISSDHQSGLRDEYNALRQVQTMLDGSVYAEACRQSVQYEDGVIVQEWREGASFQIFLNRHRRNVWRRKSIAGHCHRVVEWLAGFHRLGASSMSGGRTLLQRGATHGDFKPANIILGGRSIGVVDWELFQSDGVQITDLFHFLLYFGMTVTGSDRRRGLLATFFLPTWISGIARSCIALYVGEREHTGDSLTAAFNGYIESTLARRSALGLSNEGYFLADARTVAGGWNGTPHAFDLGPAVERIAR